jgi:NAD(P)-dependent dehydrogenase (short-subunit alcohol dehydrogenase family)
VRSEGEPVAPDYLSKLSLRGRGFVVLGAGQGIGEQVSHALAQAGARVMCVDRDESLAQKVARDIDGLPFRADVTSRPDMQQVFATAETAFGRVAGAIDIVGVSNLRALSEVDDDAWAAQFDIVLRHAFLTVQIGAKAMAFTGGGVLAFIGSLAGSLAVPNQAAYGIAKAALHHLVRSAAVEYASQGVRINAVAPGFVRTPRLEGRVSDSVWEQISSVTPLGGPALPWEVAGPLLFLVSDLSSHVCGQVLAVDGGLTARSALPELRF